MNRSHLILALSAAMISPVLAQNQADRASSAVQNFNSPTGGARNAMTQSLLVSGAEAAPELYPGEMDDVGPQFLIMQNQREAQAQEHRWVEFLLDSQYFYTSNALLTEKGNTDTGLMVNTAQLSLALPPFSLMNGQASVRAGYRHQTWLYSLDDTANQLNNIDFDVATVFGSFRHSWGQGWTASAGLDYNRYLSHDNNWNEFYIELMPSWGIEKAISINEKTGLSLAYLGAYHWTQTDPDPVKHINDRLDNILAISLNREIVSRLYLQASYRLQWSHYTENSDRNDMYNSFGLGLSYTLADWAYIRAFANYENRNSTDDLVADYSKWDTGGGLSLLFRF